MWSPSKDYRVCSEHFVDGKPTPQNPLPTLQLGYAGAEKRVKRMCLFQETGQHKRKKKVILPTKPVETGPYEVPVDDPELEILTHETHSNFPFIMAFAALFLSVFLMLIECRKKNLALMAENTRLRAEITSLKVSLHSESLLKKDEDVQFYTGLPTKTLFNKLHSLVAPLVNRRWTGTVSRPKNVRKFKKIPSRVWS